MHKIKLLLHACCAPCLIGTLSRLSPVYEPVIFFYNPNIHPKKEYEIRKKQVVSFCRMKGLKFIEGFYDVKAWFDSVSKIPNFKDEPEGGLRCSECFRLRLEETAKKAKELGFKFFTTTLTLGANKNAELINRLGVEVAERYSLFFIQADFKKRGAYLFSIEQSKKLGIYRQSYCGCVYSLKRNIESPKL